MIPITEPRQDRSASMRTVPLRERKFDLVFMVFFVVNACFITYIVDLEQLVIADPANFEYPLWPPRAAGRPRALVRRTTTTRC